MEEQNFVEISNMETIIVLKEKSPYSLLISDPMVKAQWVRNTMICQVLQMSNIKQLEEYIDKKKWIEEGLDCEILKLGESSWKKGKVRVKMTIEFCPDEPETPVYQSPLDEIYREIQGLQ